jgi:hypothetical protein
MSTIGTYTFLPWLRQGLANRIQAAATTARATVPVALKLAGQAVDGSAALEQPIQKNIELYGPGDIIGIDTRQIVKVEPRNWITNFETNYLPYIEFYDEDFPWRYTPAPPDAATGSRLQPWIMLIVLKEGEFEEGRSGIGRPLPYITLNAAEVLPAADQLWAWAHVHINRGLIAAADDTRAAPAENAPVLTEFEGVLRENPDLAYSRIVAPRRLEENTGYHALLMPTFETGRLAGLNYDPAGAPNGTASAWAPYASRTDPDDYPVYHRWFFRTSSIGDFEYLVRLLTPKPMDRRVGRRSMDVQDPGSNLPGITDPQLGGVLKLGGALQIPFDTLKPDDKADVLKYENWDEPYPHVFQRRLAEFINLAESYSRKTVQEAHDETSLPPAISNDPNPDPLITPPLYGRWHALTDRLLTTADGDPALNRRNWVHELNLDPRFRVAAGFGTTVVQRDQEKYMEAAWEQIGDVLEANRKIRQAQLAREVSWVWYNKHLRELASNNADVFFGITAPLDRRVLINGTTRHFVQRASPAPRVVVSTSMRRVARPRGRLVTALDFPAGSAPRALTTRLNAGQLHAVPPKETPAEAPTVEQLADRMEPPGVPPVVLSWLDAAPWLRFLPLILLIVLLLLIVLQVIPGGIGAGAVILVLAVLAFVLARWLGAAHQRHRVADVLRGEHHTPDIVDDIPPHPGFVLTEPGIALVPATGAADTAEGTRFKVALRDLFTLTETARKAAPIVPAVAMNVGAVTRTTLAALDPRITVVRRIGTSITIPPRIRDQLPERFVEAMAYPQFDTPMYGPLVTQSSELLLPNIQYVEQNSISLLETNQRFIEAYMVGLNHEFGRELLWREYPTDQRGSYFRQFWDVSSFLDLATGDAEALKEKLRDIPPLHLWSRASALGDHDNREAPGENEQEVVLTIRGELLKKYPTAVIYARRAAWRTSPDGSIDKTQPRDMEELTAAEEAAPPVSKLRTPLYEAKVEPDIYFFGFDLTVLEAKGESADAPDDPGWFFVIEERPGEPRFGFDIDQDGAPGGAKHLWNDVSWTDVGVADGEILPALPQPGIILTAPPAGSPPEDVRQHQEDVQIKWDDQVSAAELTYILYQVPVRVAVHASEMLPK